MLLLWPPVYFASDLINDINANWRWVRGEEGNGPSDGWIFVNGALSDWNDVSAEAVSHRGEPGRNRGLPLADGGCRAT